jgi:hypothetical protein
MKKLMKKKENYALRRTHSKLKFLMLATVIKRLKVITTTINTSSISVNRNSNVDDFNVEI